MYLAPLNYDRFFKKVFSDLKIAKRFLEDFFDITIEEITTLPTKHKITDDATAVEFDFRCKVNDQYIIIDMQQWYKSDVVKRFYAYHSLNTVLQLEKIQDKSIELDTNKVKNVKDYHQLTPVITLIWFSDDTLGFSEDFIAYVLTSDAIHEFIQNKHLWKAENLIEILQEREKCLAILNNQTRSLDFITKNKLVYVFQKNVARNPKFTKYKPWFELAEKSRDKNNEKTWFNEYLKDEIFAEVIKRISMEKLESSEWEYVHDMNEYMDKILRYRYTLKEELREEVIKEVTEEIISETKEKTAIETLINTAVKSIQAGLTDDMIASITGLPIETIQALREEHA